MDLAAAWVKTKDTTKSARVAGVNTLDALTPICSPFAARWDAEADRRNALRTQENLKALLTAQREHNSARATSATAKNQRAAARAASKNPLSTARRAARVAHKAARQQHDQARAELRTAKANYPSTLRARAVQLHTAHTTTAGIASWAMTEAAHHLTLWPAPISLGVIGLNVAGLWLGRRNVRIGIDDGVSFEERQLLERLDPSYWVQHAADRGLGGTVTGAPKVGDAGITCAIRLDGTWDLGKLRGAEQQIRALLGARTGLRIGIAHGDRGGWAEMTFRTRSAVDGADMLWTPERQGLGLDTVTGQLVEFSPFGFRLVAGATGMGKSVLLRPGMAEVLARPDAAVVYLDPKHQEFRLWGGKMRVEHEMGAIYDVTCDIVDELERRQRESTGTTWVPTPDAPEIVVVVDEGAAIVRAAKQKQFKDFLDKFEVIATMGRAGKIWLTWATQYPTKEQGIPAQVVEMMLDRAALSVESATADRTIFGENAAAKGYTPSELGGVPGLAMVRTKGRKSAAPVQTWFLDDATAAKLPAGIVWEAGDSAGRQPLRLVKDAVQDAAEVQETPQDAVPTNRERVLSAVRAGAGTAKDVTDATGLNKGTVSREVKALVDAGELVRAEDNTLAIAAGEVSA